MSRRTQSLLDQLLREGVNPFAELGVVPGADLASIKRAWRVLARRHHPDHGGDRAMFQRAALAWEALRDDQVRAVLVQTAGAHVGSRYRNRWRAEQRQQQRQQPRQRPISRPTPRQAAEVYLRLGVKVLYTILHGQAPHISRSHHKLASEKQQAYIRSLWTWRRRWLSFVPAPHQACLKTLYGMLGELTSSEASAFIQLLLCLRALGRWPEEAELLPTLDEIQRDGRVRG